MLADLNIERADARISGSALVIEDDAANRIVMEDTLRGEGMDVVSTADGIRAVELVATVQPDVVLLDVRLPVENGFSICERLKADPVTASTPIILVTSLTGRADRLTGLASGADAFLTKPFDPIELLLRVRNLIEQRRVSAGVHATAGALGALARVMEARDGTTARHSARLAANAMLLGAEVGLSDGDLETLRWAGTVHDVGKVGIPDAVLFKDGPLTGAEWAIMQSHVTVGEAIVRPLDGLSRVVPIVRSHHERWDGHGYPDGLAGRNIPPLARILQIVDVYDALLSRRPYKPALSQDRAIGIMRVEAGSSIDPDLFELFDDRVAPRCSTPPELVGDAAGHDWHPWSTGYQPMLGGWR